jgi:hypothetical protein
METRRIRRLQQRRLRRVLVVMMSIGALGLGVGLALPRSATFSVLLLALAIPSLVTIGVRAEAAAPSHGLTRVVRLPTSSAVSATLDSFRSRIVGTVESLLHRAVPQRAAAVHEHDGDAQDYARQVDLRTAPDTAVTAMPDPEGSTLVTR